MFIFPVCVLRPPRGSGPGAPPSPGALATQGPPRASPPKEKPPEVSPQGLALAGASLAKLAGVF
jgi:hypothetical protein